MGLRRVAAALVVASALAGPAIAWATAPPGAKHRDDPCATRFTASDFRAFSGEVWDPGNWERDKVKQAALDQNRKMRKCAVGPGHRAAMAKVWRKDKLAFIDYRKTMLWHREVEPYYGCTVGGCARWAIPAWSVNCESGGGAASDNLYGNTVTYYAGMSKWEQSLAAYRIMQESGYEQGWLRWETGCAGWPGP